MAITSFLAHTDDNWIEYVGSLSGARTGTLGTSIGANTTTSIPDIGMRRVGSVYTNRRYYLYFNTSSLPDSAVITKAVITLWRLDGADTIGTQVPHKVLKGTFPTGALSTSNYGDIDTGLGDVFLSAQSGTYNGSGYSTPFIANGVSASNYVGAVLNPTSFNSIINKSGNSKFVITSARDINSANGTPSDGQDGYRTISSANDALENRPLLTIEWSLPNPLANYITN